jgi:hypothetical protein
MRIETRREAGVGRTTPSLHDDGGRATVALERTDATPAWATTSRLVWSSALLVIVLLAMTLAQEVVFGYHDARLLDLRIAYTHAEVVELYGAYGTEGRQAYAIALAVDSIYPLILFAAVVLAAARAFGMRRWLWIAPASFAALDLVENSLFGLALVSYPDISPTLVAIAAPITVVKLVSFPLTVLLGVAALARLTRRHLPRTYAARP